MEVISGILVVQVVSSGLVTISDKSVRDFRGGRCGEGGGRVGKQAMDEVAMMVTVLRPKREAVTANEMKEPGSVVGSLAKEVCYTSDDLPLCFCWSERVWLRSGHNCCTKAGLKVSETQRSWKS